MGESVLNTSLALKSFFIVLLVMLLGGCNAYVGQAPSLTAEPYRSIYGASFIAVLALPAFCFTIDMLLRRTKVYANSRSATLNKIVFGLVVFLAILCEFMLPTGAYLRFDFFFIWGGVSIQGWVVLRPWIKQAQRPFKSRR